MDGTPILPALPCRVRSANATQPKTETRQEGTEDFTHVNVLGMNRRSRRTGEAETGSWPCGQSQKCCTAKAGHLIRDVTPKCHSQRIPPPTETAGDRIDRRLPRTRARTNGTSREG